MSHRNPALPGTPFGFLLVEGGDERAVCEAVAGPATWARLVCWNAQGRDQLAKLAAVAALDPNFQYARSSSARERLIPCKPTPIRGG
ncbi:MAG: hypothetical protein ABI134_03525 [Byssovorax sp.]